MALQFTLERIAFNNDADAFGLWQYEGGQVFNPQRQQVANYAVTRRVTKGGTEAQNTAMLTMTLFFLGKEPPENITVQGSHDFSSGGETGSVSAASSTFAVHIGKSFTRAGNTVTLG